jgi:hypothetical protein
VARAIDAKAAGKDQAAANENRKKIPMGDGDEKQHIEGRVFALNPWRHPDHLGFTGTHFAFPDPSSQNYRRRSSRPWTKKEARGHISVVVLEKIALRDASVFQRKYSHDPESLDIVKASHEYI